MNLGTYVGVLMRKANVTTLAPRVVITPAERREMETQRRSPDNAAKKIVIEFMARHAKERFTCKELEQATGLAYIQCYAAVVGMKRLKVGHTVWYGPVTPEQAARWLT